MAQVLAWANWPLVEFPPRPTTACRQAGFATAEFDGCRNLTALEFIDCPIGDARVAYPYYVKRELLDWSAAGSCLGEGPLTTCAVTRRRFSVGARPTRRPLSPEATGAGMEVTKCLKPPDSGHEIR